MKKTVNLKWEEFKNPTLGECWRLVAILPGGNIRLGFVRKVSDNKYLPALDTCEGGLIKINFLTGLDSLDEAKCKVYNMLFLCHMAENDMIEEIDLNWDKKVNPVYKDKIFTLVSEFCGFKIRFAHIVVNIEKEYVMFIDICNKDPGSRCLRQIDKLETAKEIIIKKLMKKEK